MLSSLFFFIILTTVFNNLYFKTLHSDKKIIYTVKNQICVSGNREEIVLHVSPTKPDQDIIYKFMEF